MDLMEVQIKTHASMGWVIGWSASAIVLKIESDSSESCLRLSRRHDSGDAGGGSAKDGSDSLTINAFAGEALGIANVSFISDENTDSIVPSFTPADKKPTVLAIKGF